MGASLPVCADGAYSRCGGYKCCIAYIIPLSQEQICVKRIGEVTAPRLQTIRSAAWQSAACGSHATQTKSTASPLTFARFALRLRLLPKAPQGSCGIRKVFLPNRWSVVGKNA